MSINLTLIGQMITFLVFVWFTMRYVWPPITKAMQERQKRIAEGLSASDRAKKELEKAEKQSANTLQEAKVEAAQLVEQANKRAAQVMDEAKEEARQQSQKIIDRAQDEVKHLALSAKEELSKNLASLVVAGAEKVVEKEIDKNAHDKLIGALVKEL